MSGFERTGSEVQWEGSFVKGGIERFRHLDGEEVTRDKGWHPGAVGILALDDEHVWLTRQPREAIDQPASLEIPAGKLDVAGEKPLETARRELAEEIGKQAAEWAQITSFYTSPGFTDERVWLFRAEGLSDCAADDLAGTPDGMAGTPGGDAHAAEDERIEIVPWPRARLWEAIDACEDAKSLIALLWLAARSASGLA